MYNKSDMYQHHKETIQQTVDFFQEKKDVLGLLLGGSIAHGFANETSDVDIMIIVDENTHRLRSQHNNLTFFSAELSTYPHGYVDGKLICPSQMELVAKQGSEPSRFAYCDSKILFSKIKGLDEIIRRITVYPESDKQKRINSFYAQLEGWYWYAGEAHKRSDDYLMNVSVMRLLLFGGRLLLAHNSVLYPYHKWFFKVLEGVRQKPDGCMELMRELSKTPNYEKAGEFYHMIKEFHTWIDSPTPWPNLFIYDSEQTWVRGWTPIDDI